MGEMNSKRDEDKTDSRKTVTPDIFSHSLVLFYRLWHGRFRLPGAGYLLRNSSRYLPGLQNYPLPIKDVGTVIVDFRDYSGLLWLQHLLGDRMAAFDVEDGLCKALKRLIREDDIFWDVGANAGIVSAFVSTTMPTVKVYAFEPNPDIFKSISSLFLKQSRVKVYPFALSDRNADVVLTIPKGKSVGGSIEGTDYVLKTSSLKKEDVDEVQVRAFRADSLIESNADVLPPTIVKIDAEGHEVAVIRGLTKTIAKARPVIFFEHLYLSDKDIMTLVPDGYSLHSLHNLTGEFTKAFDRAVGHNSVLLPLADRRKSG